MAIRLASNAVTESLNITFTPGGLYNLDEISVLHDRTSADTGLVVGVYTVSEQDKAVISNISKYLMSNDDTLSITSDTINSIAIMIIRVFKQYNIAVTFGNKIINDVIITNINDILSDKNLEAYAISGVASNIQIKYNINSDYFNAKVTELYDTYVAEYTASLDEIDSAVSTKITVAESEALDKLLAGSINTGGIAITNRVIKIVPSTKDYKKYLLDDE